MQAKDEAAGRRGSSSSSVAAGVGPTSVRADAGTSCGWIPVISYPMEVYETGCSPRPWKWDDVK